MDVIVRDGRRRSVFRAYAETVDGRIRWGTEKRLEFIEFRLFWEGGINRADITVFFGVSVPQASKDLTQYRELAPENIQYDLREKRYFATADFSPRFLKPDPDRYLNQLQLIAEEIVSPRETWLQRAPDPAAMPVPHRRVDVNVLRPLLEVIRRKRSRNLSIATLVSRADASMVTGGRRGL